MKTTNNVFIATSVDGYIADKNGGVEWLHSIPTPENEDMGFAEFTGRMDALLMGRTTYETVLGFGIDWPYQLPVYVLSTTLKEVPTELKGKVFIVNGTLKEVLNQIHSKGHHHLYIDGGRTIQSFLKENLIDELIISRIPLLLGEGVSLFSNFSNKIKLNLVSSKSFTNSVLQEHYKVLKG